MNTNTYIYQRSFLKQSLAGLVIALITAVLLSPTEVSARTPYESIPDIRRQVQQFIDSYDFGSEHPVSARVGKIDTRLRLHQCDSPLDIYFTSDNITPGRTFLGVGCSTNKPWNIYVSAQIDMYADVLVSVKSLLRGQILTSEDIILETRKVSTLRSGYFVDFKQLKNMQTTRTVRKGQVITPGLLKPEFLVTRGQQVTLVASIGGINVRMKGKALADAVSNSRVQVKNASSGRVVEGLVIERGVVKIPM